MDKTRLRDPNAPLIMFRKWTDYFPDIDVDEDDFDDGDTPPGIIAVQAMQGPFHQAMPDINKLYNFYVCSTNFKFTKQMFACLNKEVEGVETLDKISPYKLRIGIGELFDENTVRNNISMVLKECLMKSK